MAKDNHHIKQFNAEDIRRYHNGQMDPHEMHLLEKQALDDPFLADAVEGYAFTTTPAADLADINKRLAGRKTDPKAAPVLRSMSWLKVAAVVFLMAGAGWFVYRFAFQPPAPMATQPPNDTEQVRNDAANQPLNEERITTDSLVNADANYTIPGLRDQNQQKQIMSEPSADKGVFETPTLATKPVENTKAGILDSYRSDSLGQAVAGNATARVKKENIPAAPYMSRNSGPAAGTMNYFNGRVVDPNNNAVPFVTIQAKPNGYVQTDSLGFFSLTSRDTLLRATVTALGFEKNQLLLNKGENNTVVLQPLEQSLSEVVVTGVGVGAKRKVAETSSTMKIDSLEPEQGWAQFDEYVASRLNNPERQQSAQPITGEVKLSFDVNKNGEPINIKVTKSLCEQCDAEAIRLLKEGPKWKKKKNRKGKVTIRF
jgi:TonB family protein